MGLTKGLASILKFGQRATGGPNPMLELSFLGEQRITVDGENVTAAIPARTIGLIVGLVLRPDEEQPRAAIASRFWPESSDDQALTNLRRELHSLRQRLPTFADAVMTSGRSVRFAPFPGVRCDVERFITAAADVTNTTEAVRALGYYAGDLLPASSDEWLLEERARLHQRCLTLIDALTAQPDGSLSSEQLATFALRRVELEPLEEIGYRRLMQFQAASGDRAAALTTFHRCASMLERELGVPPDPATVSLYESLLRVDARPVARTSSPRPGGRVPLIGRDAELATLTNRWKQATAHEGGLHLVEGEPGIGKSRLLSEFATRVEHEGGLVASARCYPSRAPLAMAPVAEWLSAPSLRVFRSTLDPAWRAEVDRLLPVPGQPSPTTAHTTADAWQRHRFFEGLAGAVVASGQPTLLTLDDIQWCDGETLAWLQIFLRRISDSEVLVVATGRDEEFEQNAALAELLVSIRVDGMLTRSQLEPLSPAMVSELAQTIGLHMVDDDALFDATQGLPLYVIESARSDVTETSVVAALEGSPRVQAVLDGRLDQLSDEAVDVAKLAAVGGREFDAELLQLASDLPDENVIDGLDELWSRRIIVSHSRGTYDFSHDLLRDATLRRVPPARLAAMHRRVAEALEALEGSGDRASGGAGAIADHYEQAGLDDRAIPFHERAAELAMERYAHGTAIDQYRAAVRITFAQPESPDRDRRELHLRHAMSQPLNARYGFASTDLEAELERSLFLAENLGDRRLELLSLVGLFSTYVVQARLKDAYEVSIRALEGSRDEPAVVGQAHFSVAGSAFMLGRLGEALEHFALVPELTVDQPLAVVGTRPEVHSVAWQSHALWLVDRVDEAQERVEWAVARSVELDHAFSIAVASAYQTMLAQFDGRRSDVLPLAEQTLAVCSKYGFTYYGHWGRILGGWAAGGSKGRAAFEEGLSGLDALGGQIRRPYYLSLRADLQLADGDELGARDSLRLAHELALKRSDVWWLPEVLRRRAGLEEGEAAHVLLQEAHDLATAQGSQRLARRVMAEPTFGEG
jgi:DNA-binding SARP family transcriptional activator